MAALFCSQNLTTGGSLHMGDLCEAKLEVGRSSRMDAKPCGHLNVYVSGRLDVHRPSDPPCRRGSGARYGPISICTKSNEKVV